MNRDKTETLMQLEWRCTCRDASRSRRSRGPGSAQRRPRGVRTSPADPKPRELRERGADDQPLDSRRARATADALAEIGTNDDGDLQSQGSG